MLDVRANTQVIVPVGPFVDVGDGFTPETGITLGAADEAELLKHGSTSVVDIAAATWAAITSMDGYYALTLTTSHTDTEGQLTVVVQDDSVCLPVKMHFRVLSEAAYDSFYGAKDDGFMDVNVKTIGRADTQETEASNLEAACAAYSATRGLSGTALPAAAADAAGGLPISDAGGLDLDAKVGALTFTVANKVDANITNISGDATAADNAEAFFDGTGYAGTNNVIPTVTTLTNLPAITANWLTAAGTAADFGTEIGAAVLSALGTGTWLTAIPWNASWDAEVQSEAEDAIVAHRLDELLNADSDIDGAAPPTVGSVFHELLSKTAGSFTFDQTTDSLEALRDRGDAAWITATGFSTHSAADVWASATRTLTAATNITSTGGTTVPQTGDSFARIGATGSGLTSLAQASVATEARLAELDAANLPADVDQIKADLPARISRGVALSNFPFLMVDATDGYTAETGLTITATRSIDGAAFAACANSASEIGGGTYKINLASTDLDGVTIVLKFSAAGARDRIITIITQPT